MLRKCPDIALASALVLSLFFYQVLGHEVNGEEYGYEGNRGPSYWGNDYNTCVGKHQSPIDIEEHYVRNTTLLPLEFTGLHVPRAAKLSNNGHTVILKMEDSNNVRVSGGPLGHETYVFEQLHFHWGKNDLEGSEDLINNHSFAMELHAVFYKEEYGSMNEALNYPDGLTVLAYFFEVTNHPNPTFQTLVQRLPFIEEVDSTDFLPGPLMLESFLAPKPSTIENYFTYNGSLTTPPCSEVVIWIDFKDPFLLSHQQLAAFRNVRTSNGYRITHNFRPIQPLQDRVVYRNIPHVEYTSDMNPQHHHHPHHGYSGQLNMFPSIPIVVVTLFVSTR
ncbi:carbonic anhydrase 2 [Cephus cinctus]|uniref:carbonic anhydrase n=1 Tax=Cephus cinctus TaxID=211228 RepID=A0AAJ7FEX9_CEPCN|nr:carbonic anhydrase 2 [Cephus cinctus]